MLNAGEVSNFRVHSEYIKPWSSFCGAGGTIGQCFSSSTRPNLAKKNGASCTPYRVWRLEVIVGQLQC